MRNFTEEENKAYREALNKLSEPIGVTCIYSLVDNICNTWKCSNCGTLENKNFGIIAPVAVLKLLIL